MQSLISHYFLMATFAILLLSGQASAQIFIHAPTDATDTLDLEVKGYDKSKLIKFATANPKAVPQPYYRYLYVFGDGNFINGVKDSIIEHQYAIQHGKALPTGELGYEVTVYASDTYSGGNPPPDKSLQDTIIINKVKGKKDTIIVGIPADKTQSTVRLSPVTHKLSNVPVIRQVVQGNRYVALQKNHELRPKDKLVVILSIKNPIDADVNPIDGQVYVFYNGKIKGITSGMKSDSSTAFAKFNFDEALVHNRNTWKVVLDTVAPQVSQYKRMLVLSYLDLAPTEERHFFFEFTNPDDFIDYIDFAGTDTAKVDFLAVVTAINDDQSTFDPVLDDDQRDLLDSLNIDAGIKVLEAGLLASIYDSMLATQAFSPDILPFSGNAQVYPSVVLDVQALSGNIVAAKDPNHLDGYACKCGSGPAKIAYVVKFTNDGLAPTSNIFVSIQLPDELDINTLADTSYIPVPSGNGFVSVQKIAETNSLVFTMNNYRLFSTAEFGYGHPLTEGSITFSLLAKPGVRAEDVPPIQACIRFDSPTVEPLCTNFAPAQLFDGQVKHAALQAILSCAECPQWCKWCEMLNIHETWLCVLVLIAFGLLLVLLVWLLKKLL